MSQARVQGTSKKPAYRQAGKVQDASQAISLKALEVKWRLNVESLDETRRY